MSRKELSKYVFTSKYARYLRDKKRRETWHEAVTRVKEMHLGKFPELKEEIEWAFDFVYKKKVSPSQRTLQFGGKPILDNHIRGYNCCATYVDRPRVFQEIMMVLLAGCGAGFSVQKQHIEKLPNIFYGPKPEKTFVIPDSIEGWADAIGVLVSSYFEPSEDSPFPEFIGTTPIFDYSQIRPKGSLLSSSSGKAPGPDPLRISIERIRNLLDDIVSSGIKKLRPIHAHDIICHLADAVLSGGVRRSSCISLFSPDDEEMIKCKTGDWFYTNPQRARANNSVVINRKKVSREKLKSLVENIKAFGEPGIFLTDVDGGEVGNPCQSGSSIVITPAKMAVLDDIQVGDTIWSENGWVKVTNKVCTGVKDVWRYRTTAGCVYSTENHRIVQNGEKIEVGLAESIDTLVGPPCEPIEFDKQIVMDGVVFGDGSRQDKYVVLYIGKDDGDYFEHFGDLIGKKVGRHGTGWYVNTHITQPDVPNTYLRRVPDRYKFGDKKTVLSFLRGVYTANGSICGGRVTLKTASKHLVEDIQLMLSSVGISSYFTTNKPSKIKWRNGEYVSKQSYDINITKDREKFYQLIGFVQNYKMDILKEVINQYTVRAGHRKTTYDIVEAEYHSTEPVYDITVDGASHTYWHGCHNISNCMEISLYPISTYGKSGIQFCNLSSINVKKCHSPEEFYECSKAAAILGTLQAAYTDFPYLGKVTEEITRREALLGVCLSGMMDRPEIAFDPEIQRKGAEIVKATNREFAKKLGINPAARTTSVKPSGTDSLVGESAAGIHPDHSRRYFRRVQANDTENVARYFAQHNPSAVEKSVWGASSKDLSLTFCVELEEGARTKNEVSALDLLKMVKLTRENWINTGKNPELCANPELSHNVSNTIHIKDEEWDGVIDYIYENREFFGGISFLPHSGDLDYQQPPFCAVHTPREILKKYGDASLFASGLITEALGLFGDLWVACDAVLERYTQFEMTPGINRWLYNMKKFAIKYTDGDIRKLTYLMKDVYNWKRWLDLNREYQEVDYTQLKEDEDTTKLEQEVACSGGGCELI